MSGATVRCTFAPAAKPAPGRAVTKAVGSPPPQGPSRTARMLALAHHVGGQIEDGTVPDYAAAARALGLTRARMTQIANLLLLAPDIQEAILTGELHSGERGLRAVVRVADWERQRASVRAGGWKSDR